MLLCDGKTCGHMPVDAYYLPVKLLLLVWGKLHAINLPPKWLSGLKKWCYEIQHHFLLLASWTFSHGSSSLGNGKREPMERSGS